MHVILVHNFGDYPGSLHHVLGTMTESMQRTLKNYDVVSQKAAERKYVLKEGGAKSKRCKKSTNPKNNAETSYEPGCEPI